MYGLPLQTYTVAILISIARALPSIAYEKSSVGDPFSSLSVQHRSFFVLGLTPGCHLYCGNIDSNKIYKPYVFLEGFGDACKNKHPFIVRSYGEAQHMLIVVDRYGRRVRVQPALSRYRVPSGINETDAIIHWVDPRNRLQQFYSDPVDEGFTIAGFYYFKSRVLVYALSHYGVRFYDLRLHTKKNFITPYLELLAEPDLQLVLPHMLRLYGQGFTSDSITM
ncbi:hypothetical protein Y032_0056g2653 [Ancylostoma ceylanicum]|uniref:Uncharacterized protein n=1 Tax=Ancylostoma ceylanicum TaxID=53326 RepID=A0A016U5Q3_9BILA|nr:hypothetical protein Y032_0056g2653 [Ancylostoma ceylanicum]